MGRPSTSEKGHTGRVGLGIFEMVRRTKKRCETRSAEFTAGKHAETTKQG